MKKRIKILSAVLAVLFAVAAFAGCGASTETSENSSVAEDASNTGEGVNVGGLWSLTGFMADYEIAGSEGFELALDEINEAGGIDGIKVGYTSYDTGSEVDKATSLITKLIEVDNANVIVGMGDPNAAIAAGTVAQEHGVPTLANSSTLPYTQDRVGDTAFLVPYGDNVQAAAVAEYAYNELGLKTAYVVTDTTDEYTLALSKYFQLHFKTLGGKILGESTYDDNGYTDFSASIAKVKALSKQPDALFFASFTDQGPTMLKQFRDAGLDQVVLSGDGLDSAEIAKIAGKAADNVYFSTSVDYTSDSDKIAHFNKIYKEKYGSKPNNSFAALGYDAAYLIKYAVEKYANGDYSAANIRDAIAKVTDFDGLTGTISYADGNVPTKTVFLSKFEDGDKKAVTSIVPTFTDEEKDK